MQILYAYDISPLTNFDDHWRDISEMLNIVELNMSFAKELAYGTIKNLREINDLLSKFLKNWTLSRVEKVAMAMMRVSTYELLYQTKIPHAVVINEAIEIAKIFAEPDSGQLVNGVLDSICKKLSHVEHS
jgi:N utilization substance protein B